MSDKKSLLEEEDSDTENGSSEPKENIYVWKIVFCGLSFCALFTAFNGTQNLQSSVNKQKGEWSLAVLYFAFSLSNFFSPIIVRKIGEKWSLFLGATMYCLYIAANIHVIPAVLMGAAALNGFGASILWTAQGTYLTKCSPDDSLLGRNSGIFFGIFQLNQVFGNLISGVLLLRWSNHTVILWIVFTSIAGLATASFLLLQPVSTFETDPVPVQETSILKRLTAMLSILKRKTFLLLLFLMIYSGMSQTFFFGVFTKQISDKSSVGFVMTCFGAANVLGSFTFGRVQDKIGRIPCLIFGSIIVLGSTLTLAALPKQTLDAHLYIFYITGILNGFADSSANTIVYATLGVLFRTEIEAGFASFRFIQATTTGVLFFIGTYMSLEIFILALDCFLVVGVLSYGLLDICVASVDLKKEEVLAYTEPSINSYQ